MDKYYRQPHKHPDEQLLREALKALGPVADLLRHVATAHHDNLEPVQELRVLKVLNPARTTITKLEQRLLVEKVK